MNLGVISVMDIIHILLLLGACFACYVKGRIVGTVTVVNLLLEKRKISIKDLEDLEP